MTEFPCTCGSPLGCEAHGPQPRDHAVPCIICRRPTWAVSARCPKHAEPQPRHRVTNPLWSPVA